MRLYKEQEQRRWAPVSHRCWKAICPQWANTAGSTWLTGWVLAMPGARWNAPDHRQWWSNCQGHGERTHEKKARSWKQSELLRREHPGPTPSSLCRPSRPGHPPAPSIMLISVGLTTPIPCPAFVGFGEIPLLDKQKLKSLHQYTITEGNSQGISLN